MNEPTAVEIVRFWRKVKYSEECWEWTGAHANFGYGLTRIGSRWERAHRVAWTMFEGDIPKGLRVLHSCDNPPCVRPDHLFLGTQQDNLVDMTVKGRRAHSTGRPQQGELNRSRKLSDDIVRDIRRLRAEGLRQREIAERFGVNRATVAYVLLGRTWTHVQ